MPDYEEWAFAPGAVVRCAWKSFTDGEQGLEPISLAE